MDARNLPKGRCCPSKGGSVWYRRDSAPGAWEEMLFEHGSIMKFRRLCYIHHLSCSPPLQAFYYG